MKILAVISGKGGSAKTTTSVALAGIFHAADRRVVLIDLDPVGGATDAAGVDPGTLAAGIVDVLAGTTPAKRAIVTVGEGYGLLGASPRLIGEESRALMTFPRLRTIDADLVILDLAPGFGRFAQAAAKIADGILVPVLAEPLAVRTVQYVLGMLDGVDARANLIGILPTMYEPRRLLSGDQLAELLKLGNVLPPIPRSVVASEAVLAGRSVVAYAPKSPVSEAYRALAVRIERALL